MSSPWTTNLVEINILWHLFRGGSVLGSHTISSLGVSVPEHFLEYEREKSFVSSPQTITIVRTAILAIPGDTFNKI